MNKQRYIIPSTEEVYYFSSSTICDTPLSPAVLGGSAV